MQQQKNMKYVKYGVRTVLDASLFLSGKRRELSGRSFFYEIHTKMPTTELENPLQASALASTVRSTSQAHGQRFVLSNFPVPQPVDCQGDLPSKWEFLCQQWEDYKVATELSLQTMTV